MTERDSISKKQKEEALLRYCAVLADGLQKDEPSNGTLGCLRLRDRGGRDRVHGHLKNVCHLSVHRKLHIPAPGLWEAKVGGSPEVRS